MRRRVHTVFRKSITAPARAIAVTSEIRHRTFNRLEVNKILVEKTIAASSTDFFGWIYSWIKASTDRSFVDASPASRRKCKQSLIVENERSERGFIVIRANGRNKNSLPIAIVPFFEKTNIILSGWRKTLKNRTANKRRVGVDGTKPIVQEINRAKFWYSK